MNGGTVILWLVGAYLSGGLGRFVYRLYRAWCVERGTWY